MHLHSLPRDIQKLIRTMRNLSFGRIERLPIRNGLPILTECTLTRVHKLDRAGDRSGPDEGDFELKAQHVRLVERIAGIGTGVIKQIEVQHGLPFRIEENFALPDDRNRG